MRVHVGWTKEQMLQIQLQTIEASFASGARKVELEAATRDLLRGVGVHNRS